MTAVYFPARGWLKELKSTEPSEDDGQNGYFDDSIVKHYTGFHGISGIV